MGGTNLAFVVARDIRLDIVGCVGCLDERAMLAYMAFSCQSVYQKSHRLGAIFGSVSRVEMV